MIDRWNGQITCKYILVRQYDRQMKWTNNLYLSSSAIINQTVTKAITGYIGI